MIRSAVRTTLRSLLRSDLVAELNQTVIEMQRMDSMMADQNWFSSSCGNEIVPLQVLRNCGAQEIGYNYK